MSHAARRSETLCLVVMQISVETMICPHHQGPGHKHALNERLAMPPQIRQVDRVLVAVREPHEWHQGHVQDCIPRHCDAVSLIELVYCPDFLGGYDEIAGASP